MEFVNITIVVLNFAMNVAIMMWVMQIATKIRSQSNHTHQVKAQLIQLYERLGELTQKSESLSAAQKAEIDKAREELIEIMRKGRNETMRENDDIKFLVKQVKTFMEGDNQR